MRLIFRGAYVIGFLYIRRKGNKLKYEKGKYIDARKGETRLLRETVVSRLSRLLREWMRIEPFQDSRSGVYWSLTSIRLSVLLREHNVPLLVISMFYRYLTFALLRTWFVRHSLIIFFRNCIISNSNHTCIKRIEVSFLLIILMSKNFVVVTHFYL